MHLRHLIVLIIDARNHPRRSCNRRIGHGLERYEPRFTTRCIFDRSDQINQNSRAVAVSLRGADQTSSEASLNDVERSGRAPSEDEEQPNLLSVCDVVLRVGIGGADRDRTDDLKLAKLPLSQLS